MKLKKTTISTLIALLLALSSCKSAPKIEKQVRRIYSINFNICLCQWYDLNKIKNLTEAEPCEDFFSKNFPDIPLQSNLEYCNDLVGFNAEDWALNITPWGRELRRWAEDTCK